MDSNNRWAGNPRFGAEVESLDLKTVDSPDILRLKMLLAERGLILFRNQVLEDMDLVRFARLIGNGQLEPSARKVSHGSDDRNVAYLTNLRRPDGTPLGFAGDTTDYWHSDQEFRLCPASIGILFCLIPATHGGATRFVTTAVESTRLDGREIAILKQTRSTRRPAASHDNAPQITVSHPVIVTNPFTGREFVYVSENTLEFIGEAIRSSADPKASILARVLEEANQYVHVWRSGDLILYDNAQLLHRREEFVGLRFLKALKVYLDGIYTPTLKAVEIVENVDNMNRLGRS